MSGPYLGDFDEGALVHLLWDSNSQVGASITRATNGTISVYKNVGTTQSTAGVTDTEDFDGLTGIHAIAIATSSDAAFYAGGNDFTIILSGATIDGQSVNAVLGQFSINNRVGTYIGDIKDANVTQWNGVNVASPHTAGYPVVTVKDGTGTGEIDTTSGGVLVAAIAANAITATAIAANAITSAKIATDAIGAAQIAADAIGSSELAASAVTEIQAGLSTLTAAQVNTEVDTALADARLDELLAADSDIDGAAPPTVGSVFHELLTKTAGSFTYDQTTDSLEALRDNLATASALATVQADTDDLQSKLGTPSNLGSGATVAANLVDIEGQTDDIGVAGAGLTAIPWNASWDAEVQSEVQDAIEVNNLDHLVKIAVDTDFATTVHLNSVVGHLADNGTSATFDRTTDSLEALQGQVQTIDDFLDTEVAAILADTNELQTDWVDGGRLDLILDARASQASLDTLDDYVDTEVAAIKAKTDQLTFTVANRIDANDIDRTGYALTTTEHTNIADALLKRDWTAVGATATRSVLNALRFLRNRRSIVAGVLSVTEEDDTTIAWSANLTTNSSAQPITDIDPT